MAAFDYPVAERLQQVTQPILVLNPEDDLHEQSLRAGNIMQNGSIKELPGWGHGFLEIHTAEAAQIVRDFLDRGQP